VWNGIITVSVRSLVGHEFLPYSHSEKYTGASGPRSLELELTSELELEFTVSHSWEGKSSMGSTDRIELVSIGCGVHVSGSICVNK